MTKPVFKNGAWVLPGGQKLVNVHEPEKCAGEHCCIHNPSNHHMQNWPMNFRADRGFMERICPPHNGQHSIGHPDPDDPFADPVHGCDGCCDPNNQYRDLD